MDYMAELTAIANSHNGIIETKTATQHGISAPVLSAFCKKGEIVRVGRGRYALYDDMEDEFLMISLRCKKAVFLMLRLFPLTVFLMTCRLYRQSLSRLIVLSLKNYTVNATYSISGRHGMNVAYQLLK